MTTTTIALVREIADIIITHGDGPALDALRAARGRRFHTSGDPGVWNAALHAARLLTGGRILPGIAEESKRLGTAAAAL